jgi:hypothetical protein
MIDDDRSFEERFASLEEASRALSADVSALNLTLQVVAQLQTEQREQATRQAKTEESVKTAKVESELRDARTRQVVNMVALTLAVLLPLVSILVYWSLLNHVNSLIAQQQADRFASCTVRNAATLENVRRETELGKIEPNDTVRAIHVQSAQILQKGVIDCNRYKVNTK